MGEVDNGLLTGKGWCSLLHTQSKLWRGMDMEFALREFGPCRSGLYSLMVWEKTSPTPQIKTYHKVDYATSQDGLSWAYGAAFRYWKGTRNELDVWNSEKYPHLYGEMFFGWRPGPFLTSNQIQVQPGVILHITDGGLMDEWTHHQISRLTNVLENNREGIQL